jgi:DNA replicative helicase MCM subunit Mcm2 (Cdc46/Mcm family)
MIRLSEALAKLHCESFVTPKHVNKIIVTLIGKRSYKAIKNINS